VKVQVFPGQPFMLCLVIIYLLLGMTMARIDSYWQYRETSIRKITFSPFLVFFGPLVFFICVILAGLIYLLNLLLGIVNEATKN
jgi:hypothetical protein